MADIIKMLLQANIDVGKSIIDINEQIKEISKQADAIKIKVDIDKEVFDNIKNINDKLNAVAGKTVKPIKIETPDIEKAKNQFQELNNEISKMSGFDPSKTPIHKGMEIISWSVKDAGDGTKKFTQTLNDGKDSIITYNGVLSKTSGQYEILGKTVRQSTRENQTFLKELDIAIRRSITWMLGMTAVYGSLRKVREGITFIKELDKELTQVSIITQKTREETYQLAQEYAKLGKQLGKTIKEISSVNTELIRQGLSLEESQQRLLTIMRLNAVSDVDMNPQETLKVITSSVNALKTEAEHAGDVILKASQISASSVSEIGNALTKTASSAQVTGMTIEQLVGIISTLEEVTQESASSLGTSVKTLLARFNKINEETGEINKEL
ncbi:TPA: phage tail tape measure protein, partial [bacterium]|nr:phage tail tape measure protein [bacterium]